ncbi:glutamine transport system permease protein [Rhodobium orientis]|uniref:Glutamine ABC transporter permease GlnP n=1 Tax=Rhodobium orientis TaxID=34017 RepID=A0A327JNA7_9HYPH|nr:glutamine ABC transporter permease GlnP [Rhodobium orientis]MBB4301298.1 glutamine transport system permease protein [Rhodobium orientis]MBK5951113.1 glutamine ABC transporter permease GlnP [Rhodobium orientis]RAI26824.1 glutamine ABC transporter permease GlnP [Rhodobium orientis]
MDFQFDVVVDSIPVLMEGLALTLQITFLGVVGGIALGVLAGLARVYGNVLINGIAMIYIEVIRGTPLVVQVMFIYFALPLATGLRVAALYAAIFAIVLNSGAYIAEIVRGAVLSINKGLIEAGKALGVSSWQNIVYIVGPLAFRRMVPPLGNQVIISLKDTSLFIVIGVGELTRQGQEIIATNFRALEVWTSVALIYLAVTTILAYLLRLLERRIRIL